MEWLQGFGTSEGMSLAVQGGKLQLYLNNPYWTSVGTIDRNLWYHVAVTKQPGEVRIYLNGHRVYTAPTPLLGDQTTEVAIGASTWRGAGHYGDFFDGAISQVALWKGALTDSQVVASYLADAPTIRGITGVERPRSRLALAGMSPNPAIRNLRVAFTLASAEPASITLLDVTGRRVVSREVGSLGAGSHTVDLGSTATVPTGVYWIKLTQGGHTLSSKATVMR